MAESGIGTETLEAGQPLTVGGVTLLPIERVAVRAHGKDGCGWVFGSKDFCALVLCEAGGIRAVDACAEAVRIEELVEKVPGLGATLTAMGLDHEQRSSTRLGACFPTRPL